MLLTALLLPPHCRALLTMPMPKPPFPCMRPHNAHFRPTIVPGSSTLCDSGRSRSTHGCSSYGRTREIQKGRSRLGGGKCAQLREFAVSAPSPGRCPRLLHRLALRDLLSLEFTDFFASCSAKASITSASLLSQRADRPVHRQNTAESILKSRALCLFRARPGLLLHFPPSSSSCDLVASLDVR